MADYSNIIKIQKAIAPLNLVLATEKFWSLRLKHLLVIAQVAALMPQQGFLQQKQSYS